MAVASRDAEENASAPEERRGSGAGEGRQLERLLRPTRIPAGDLLFALVVFVIVASPAPVANPPEALAVTLVARLLFTVADLLAASAVLPVRIRASGAT